MKQITITITVEFKNHREVILTNPQGDTYTSTSEELKDFLHYAKTPVSAATNRLFMDGKELFAEYDKNIENF